MKTLICIIFLALTHLGFGQEFLPISSVDALRTFAVEQAGYVSASIQSNIQVGENSGDFVAITDPSVAKIEKAIREMPLSIKVANPKDSLHVFASVYSNPDPNGAGFDNLFYSTKKTFALVLQNGVYTLPKGFGDVELVLADEIPIMIKDANSAQMNMLNDAGETIAAQSVRVENGRMYFPRKLAGKNAILTVQTLFEQPNGTYIQDQLFWNVKNGGKITTQYFATPLNASIKNMVTITDAQTNVIVPTTKGLGENKTLEFTSTKTVTAFTSFQTSENKWFVGAWVRKSKETEWVYYPGMMTSYYMYIQFQVTPGVYYIIPKWNPQDLTPPVEPWVTPTYEGGIG